MKMSKSFNGCCFLKPKSNRSAAPLQPTHVSVPVLEEYDAVLTGATLQLDLRPDGRIAHYGKAESASRLLPAADGST